MLRTPAPLIGALGVMKESLAQIQRWMPLMQQVHEAVYYIGRALHLGHPEQFSTLEGQLEFLLYFRGALSAYSKCFTSTGLGRMSLDGNSIYKARPNLKLQHDQFIVLRNTYTAHSDDNELETVQAIANETDDEIVVYLNYAFTFPFDRLYELRDLIGYLESEIIDRHTRHVQKLNNQVGKATRVAQGDRSAPIDENSNADFRYDA